ncbi:MAG: PaaI family thioesterase [Candidatus Auribacterota bacterium]|jgi:uncharacterized protein (TIGR00369 family)|nr:PaaI family thioesterase [Candidatus Auribacterota bacterium]
MMITQAENAKDNLLKIRRCTHPNCIVCSLSNSRGLNIDFDVSENGEVKADIQFDKQYEGYQGMLHGGVISTILDGAMTNCIFACGQTAVTVEMNIRFRHPVLLCHPLTVVARIVQYSYPLYFLESEIIQNGGIKVNCKAKFYEQSRFSENCM